MKIKNVQNIIFLVIFFLFSNQTWAADWIYFDTAAVGDVYYDKSSIKKVSENIISVWNKDVLSEQAKRKYFSLLKEIHKAPKNQSMLNYYTKLMEIDCVNKKIKDISVIFYNEKGKVVYASPKSESGEWNDILPNTVGEKLINLVSCEPVVSKLEEPVTPAADAKAKGPDGSNVAVTAAPAPAETTAPAAAAPVETATSAAATAPVVATVPAPNEPPAETAAHAAAATPVETTAPSAATTPVETATPAPAPAETTAPAAAAPVETATSAAATAPVAATVAAPNEPPAETAAAAATPVETKAPATATTPVETVTPAPTPASAETTAPAVADKNLAEVSNKQIEPKSSSEEAVRTLLTKWLNSWRSGDMKTYRSFYESNFKSEVTYTNALVSYKTNVRQKNKKINISIDKLQISANENMATAVFTQYYSSSLLKYSGKKKLELRKINDEWKIFREIM